MKTALVIIAMLSAFLHVAVVAVFLLAATSMCGQGWWLAEPVSLLQTNLRETDSGLDGAALVREVSEFPANTLLFSVGGIVAQYPTNVAHHFKSAHLKPGQDPVGTVVAAAHRRGIRVIGRFDFSRSHQAVYEMHPEWFFRQKTGEPVVDDNGLYTTCINGGYYREKAVEVLTEALGRYELDGVFCNWFGNVGRDYHGRLTGLCHCAECERRFRQQHGRGIPDQPDAEYEAFIHQCGLETAGEFAGVVHALRPEALFMTYLEESTDLLVSESGFYKNRPLPQWLYASSEQVNRARGNRPDKMSCNLVMPYQEMRYRFATTAGPGLRALLYQSIAHGAFPAFAMLGTMEQPDRTALRAVRPVFQGFARDQDEYVGLRSAARVILYASQAPSAQRESGDYRGFYKLLSELHIPFKVTHQVSDLNPSEIDLVIVAQAPVPAGLAGYVQAGGAVLIAGTLHPGPPFEGVKRFWRETTSAYMRIVDADAFPSLRDTSVVFWEGDYLELDAASAPITLIPPSQFGPPEKVATLNESTEKAGLVMHRAGLGQMAFLPWRVGDLYHRFGNDKHRALISDLVDQLLPNRQRQLRTNAHPSVEITVMKQEGRNQTLVQLVNLSGHSGTTFFEAVPMKDITMELRGGYASASVVGEGAIRIQRAGDYSRFTVPVLVEHCAIRLNR